jgi:hypothetical protein
LVQNPLSFEKKPLFPAYAIRFIAETLPLYAVSERLNVDEKIRFFKKF